MAVQAPSAASSRSYGDGPVSRPPTSTGSSASRRCAPRGDGLLERAGSGLGDHHLPRLSVRRRVAQPVQRCSAGTTPRSPRRRTGRRGGGTAGGRRRRGRRNSSDAGRRRRYWPRCRSRRSGRWARAGSAAACAASRPRSSRRCSATSSRKSRRIRNTPAAQFHLAFAAGPDAVDPVGEQVGRRGRGRTARRWSRRPGPRGSGTPRPAPRHRRGCVRSAGRARGGWSGGGRRRRRDRRRWRRSRCWRTRPRWTPGR